MFNNTARIAAVRPADTTTDFQGLLSRFRAFVGRCRGSVRFERQQAQMRLSDYEYGGRAMEIPENSATQGW